MNRLAAVLIGCVLVCLGPSTALAQPKFAPLRPGLMRIIVGGHPDVPTVRTSPVETVERSVVPPLSVSWPPTFAHYDVPKTNPLGRLLAPTNTGIIQAVAADEAAYKRSRDPLGGFRAMPQTGRGLTANETTGGQERPAAGSTLADALRQLPSLSATDITRAFGFLPSPAEQPGSGQLPPPPATGNTGSTDPTAGSQQGTNDGTPPPPSTGQPPDDPSAPEQPVDPPPVPTIGPPIVTKGPAIPGSQDDTPGPGDTPSPTTGIFALEITPAHGPLFTAENFKPGDMATGTVTLTNAGNIDFWYSMSVTGGSGPLWNDPDNGLQLDVRAVAGTGASLYNGSLKANTKPLGFLRSGKSVQLELRVWLPLTAGDDKQGQDVTFSITWVATEIS